MADGAKKGVAGAIAGMLVAAGKSNASSRHDCRKCSKSSRVTVSGSSW